MASTARLKAAALIVGCALVLASGLIGLWQTRTPIVPSQILRVGIDPSLPPFSFYAGDQVVGFEIDLANALAQELGVQVQWVALGFDGLYDALRADRVDVIIAAVTPDPLRFNDARYTRSYYDAGLVLVSLTNNIREMSDLDRGALAYAFGSAAHEESDRWLRRVTAYQTLPFETPVHALDALRLGQADAALVTATDMQLYRRIHGDWQAIASFVTHQPFVIAVNPRLGRLAGALNTNLDRLEAEGILAALLRRWLY
jgi:polar amino acid transport system substrate-binding protein